MNNVHKYMPPMLTDDDLKKALSVLPPYNPNIRTAPTAQRLIELSQLYDIYYPSPMSSEIYYKLYLALHRSLQKKHMKAAIQQGNINRHGLQSGIIGGSDSFTILGLSGVGKSSAIQRATHLIAPKPIIETKNPYSRIAPIITVQTPSDLSIKGLLLEILRVADEVLDTNYHNYAIRTRATTDALIGSVANVCLHSVGLLILDEFQNICGRDGNKLMGTLLNLINSSGISVTMVGTLETKAFFADATFQMSRRSLGLEYSHLPLDDCFFSLCKVLTSYLYVREDFHLTDDIVQWLYSHSNGITSVVVSLIHDAQEISILDGTESLCMASLNKAYQQRLALLHNHIDPPSVKYSPIKKLDTTPIPIENSNISVEEYISSIVSSYKIDGGDLLAMLREQIEIVEVSV